MYVYSFVLCFVVERRQGIYNSLCPLQHVEQSSSVCLCPCETKQTRRYPTLTADLNILRSTSASLCSLRISMTTASNDTTAYIHRGLRVLPANDSRVLITHHQKREPPRGFGRSVQSWIISGGKWSADTDTHVLTPIHKHMYRKYIIHMNIIALMKP